MEITNQQNIQIENEPQAIFNYEGVNTKIQCNLNDKIKDIINKFLNKIEKNENNLFYLYNGKIINKELTFNEQANELDKKRKIMNILVTGGEKEKEEIIISKDIICPECKEITLLDINNFKINFHDCKNGHNINNIFLDKYEETQKIILNNIKCNICNINHLSSNSQNDFSICKTCNKNICKDCKSKHNKNHVIINYDNKDCLCNKHIEEKYLYYCKTCKKDICILCKSEHEKHVLIDFNDIIIKDDDISKTMKDLIITIEKLKNKIIIIQKVFNRLISAVDFYYDMNKIIIDNYNLNKRNYYKLQNLYYLKNNNEMMIKYINNIIDDNQIFNIYKFPNDQFSNSEDSIYIGEMERYFISYYKNGKGIEFFNNGDIYEGNYKNNKKEGKGIYYFNFGDNYEGDYKNDERDGKGIYYYNNGDRYEGDFKNGKFEGKGKYYYKNGDRYEGFYKNDKREGEGIMYYRNGVSEKGIWKNGQLNIN